MAKTRSAMGSRDPNGSDSLWVIGELFVALINLVIVVPIQIIVDIVRARRRRKQS
jgi:hypothetical protein